MGKSPIKGKAGKVATSSTEIIELDLFDIKKI